jgi:hypothetical protein
VTGEPIAVFVKEGDEKGMAEMKESRSLSSLPKAKNLTE